MPRIWWLLLLLFIFFDSKLNNFGFWAAGRTKHQIEDIACCVIQTHYILYYSIFQQGYTVGDKQQHTMTKWKDKASTTIKELKTFNDFANNILIWINKT